jgi:ribosomal protein L37E
MNAARPPYCSASVRMSGVFGQTFGRKYSRPGPCASSVKYSVSSCLVLRHAKYVYDCVKPSLARRCMTFGRVNASARKMTSACARCTSSIAHSQNANALVCGLSTRKIRTPSPTQKSITLFSSAHSAFHSADSKLNG